MEWGTVKAWGEGGVGLGKIFPSIFFIMKILPLDFSLEKNKVCLGGWMGGGDFSVSLWPKTWAKLNNYKTASNF